LNDEGTTAQHRTYRWLAPHKASGQRERYFRSAIRGPSSGGIATDLFFHSLGRSLPLARRFQFACVPRGGNLLHKDREGPDTYSTSSSTYPNSTSKVGLRLPFRHVAVSKQPATATKALSCWTQPVLVYPESTPIARARPDRAGAPPTPSLRTAAPGAELYARTPQHHHVFASPHRASIPTQPAELGYKIISSLIIGGTTGVYVTAQGAQEVRTKPQTPEDRSEIQPPHADPRRWKNPRSGVDCRSDHD